MAKTVQNAVQNAHILLNFYAILKCGSNCFLLLRTKKTSAQQRQQQQIAAIAARKTVNCRRCNTLNCRHQNRLVVGDDDGVFILAAQLVVFGLQRPAVSIGVDAP